MSARQAYATARLLTWWKAPTFAEALTAFRRFGEDFDGATPPKYEPPVLESVWALRKKSNGAKYEARPLHPAMGRSSGMDRGDLVRVRREGASQWQTYHVNIVADEFEGFL